MPAGGFGKSLFMLWQNRPEQSKPRLSKPLYYTELAMSDRGGTPYVGLLEALNHIPYNDQISQTNLK